MKGNDTEVEVMSYINIIMTCNLMFVMQETLLSTNILAHKHTHTYTHTHTHTFHGSKIKS